MLLPSELDLPKPLLSLLRAREGGREGGRVSEASIVVCTSIRTRRPTSLLQPLAEPVFQPFSFSRSLCTAFVCASHLLVLLSRLSLESLLELLLLLLSLRLSMDPTVSLLAAPKPLRKLSPVTFLPPFCVPCLFFASIWV